MQSDASGPDNGPGRLAPVRILVLDDEPMIRYFIGRTLEEEGYEVVMLTPGFRRTRTPVPDAH